MTIKVLQLNMWGGRQFPIIQEFLASNHFDILNFQEVVKLKPEKSDGRPTADCFASLQETLGPNYAGQLAIHSTFTEDSALENQGNAIFYRKDFPLLDQKTIWLYERKEPFPSGATSYEDMGRNFLHLTLNINNRPYDILDAHLAWARTPIEQTHERIQNVKLIEYVKTLKNPFILTGDFNIRPDQQSILDLEKLGQDLTKQYSVVNTLDGTLHKAWYDIQPGFPVDYIFTSFGMDVVNFQVLNMIHLSDHYGLTATLEL